MTFSDLTRFVRSRKGTVLSVVLHVLVLGWGLVSFSARSMVAPPEDLVPVDVISEDNTSKAKAGALAGRKEVAKLLADKLGEKKPTEDIVGKVDPKPVTETDAAPTPQPKPEKPVEKKPDPPKPVEKQPDTPKPVAEKKPDPPKPPAPAEKPKPEEKKPDAFNPDQIANVLNKDKPKQPPKPQAAATPPEPPKHKSERKFDVEKMASLINQKDPTRQAVTGTELNANAALGTARGTADSNIASWSGAFQTAVRRCFGFPYNGQDADMYEADIDIPMRLDGTVAGEPKIVAVRGPSRTVAMAMAESARRAIIQCQSYSFLPKNQYDLEVDSTRVWSERFAMISKFGSKVPKHSMNEVSRRRFIAGAGAAAAALGWSGALAQAQQGNRLRIDPTDFKPIPIAIPPFVAGGPGDADVANGISQVITNNLKRSGYFAPVDPAAFVERITNFDQVPQFASWKPLNVQGLLTGRATRQSDGRLSVQFRLWDVNSAQQAAAQQYVTAPEYWRRIAHIISDQIYTTLLGEKGYFDSRVVFVDETGPSERRVKRLALMDQDGANVRYLTRGADLVLTPRFSPSSQEITYMEFGQGDPKVYLFNIETGQREIVGNFPGMSFSPRFSPDGQRIIMSLQQGGNSNLFVMDLRSRTTTRLTDTPAIDTSPSYSPDGSQLCFESDRGGKPQIYVMPASGGNAQRISFGEGSYSTPVWSPRGDYIAFTKQGGGQFAIGIMKTDGSGERILTSGFHNEGPTFSPNGRVLMFFRDPGGTAGPSLYTIDVSGRFEQKVPTPGYASDPAWSPLLS